MDLPNVNTDPLNRRPNENNPVPRKRQKVEKSGQQNVVMNTLSSSVPNDPKMPPIGVKFYFMILISVCLFLFFF